MTNRLALCFELPSGQVPEWVELIPAPDSAGKITGRDGRSWVFDVEAQRNVLDAFITRAVALVIDREHATQHRAPNGEEAPAAAWIEQLEIRSGGALWGKVDWTPRGREQVAGREYRYLSPVFDYDQSTGRITRLVSAGLTNTPNLRLSALNVEDSRMKLTTAIASALGLDAGATEDDALAAIQKLKADRDTARNAERAPSLDRYVPRADYDALMARATNAERQLQERDAAAHKAAVDAEIEAALKAGKITPATADYHRAMCSDQAGLERFRAFVGAAPVIAGDSVLCGKKPNNETALNAEELAVIARTGITEAQFRAARAEV